MSKELQAVPDSKEPEQRDINQFWETFTGRVFRPITLQNGSTVLLDVSETDVHIPTLRGPTALGGRLVLKRGADLASALTLNIPGNANIHRVTGTTLVGAMTGGVAGLLVVLEFASAGCVIEAGTNPVLPAGNYVSTAGGTLTLEHDGSVWHEVARAPQPRPQVGTAVGGAGDSTSSTSFVDLDDMSVTLTTRGGDVLVWFSGAVSNGTTGEDVIVGVKLDAGTTVEKNRSDPSNLNDLVPISFVHRFTGVAAGSHTVKVQWKVDGSTGECHSTRFMLVMEV